MVEDHAQEAQDQARKRVGFAEESVKELDYGKERIN